MSPIHHLPARKRALTIAYGTDELPELRRQSKDYWHAWSDNGGRAELLALEPHNHFSILDELASPDGRLARAAEALATLPTA